MNKKPTEHKKGGNGWQEDRNRYKNTDRPDQSERKTGKKDRPHKDRNRRTGTKGRNRKA